MSINENKFYKLPDLLYNYNALEPYISEEQLEIHHQKHHAGYAKGANVIFEKLDRAREKESELDFKSTLKELSFNVGGFVLHSLFWNNLAPAGISGEPSENLKIALENEFGSIERFKEEFTKTALSIEWSGWAALTFCNCIKRPLIMQIEKHNLNIYPAFKMLLVLDMWEHAYYLDYKNDRAKYIEAFWKIVNWEKAGDRLEK